MNKLIQISVEFWLEKINAPAVDFSTDEVVCLEVEILGKKIRTTDVPLKFPLGFHQRLIFKRTYKHATIMRAVEHLYHDRLAIKLFRRNVGCQEGQLVVRFDESTGNTLLNDDGANWEVENTKAQQVVELRTCVEGFCFRPKLTFSSFITFREMASIPSRNGTTSAFCQKSLPQLQDDEYPKQFNLREINEKSKVETSKEDEFEESTQKCQNFTSPDNTTEEAPESPAGYVKRGVRNRPLTGNPTCHVTASPTKVNSAGLHRQVLEDFEWDGMCERPPFVVRHVDCITRTPKLHKSMSQETNLMLMQYQLDHPSDVDVQKVSQNKVPIRLYKKLRQQYDQKHSAFNGAKKRGQNSALKMRCQEKFKCNVASVGVVRAQAPSTSKTARTAPTADFTVGGESVSRNIPCSPEPPNWVPIQTTNAKDCTSVKPIDFYDMEEVKKFLRMAGSSWSRKDPETAKGDCGREGASASQNRRDDSPLSPWESEHSQSTEKDLSGSCKEKEPATFADDRQLVAVYREVTRTLHRDTIRRQQQSSAVRRAFNR